MEAYLKINEFYEVPLWMIEELVDGDWNDFAILRKGQGGFAQLRHHVLWRDRTRDVEAERACTCGEEKKLEDDVESLD